MLMLAIGDADISRWRRPKAAGRAEFLARLFDGVGEFSVHRNRQYSRSKFVACQKRTVRAQYTQSPEIDVTAADLHPA
jgi:hypothetical protein